MSLMRNFRCYIKELANDAKYYNSLDAKDRTNMIDNFFIFAAIWSLGSSLKL